MSDIISHEMDVNRINPASPTVARRPKRKAAIKSEELWQKYLLPSRRMPGNKKVKKSKMIASSGNVEDLGAGSSTSSDRAIQINAVEGAQSQSGSEIERKINSIKSDDPAENPQPTTSYGTPVKLENDEPFASNTPIGNDEPSTSHENDNLRLEVSADEDAPVKYSQETVAETKGNSDDQSTQNQEEPEENLEADGKGNNEDGQRKKIYEDGDEKENNVLIRSEEKIESYPRASDIGNNAAASDNGNDLEVFDIENHREATDVVNDAGTSNIGNDQQRPENLVALQENQEKTPISPDVGEQKNQIDSTNTKGALDSETSVLHEEEAAGDKLENVHEREESFSEDEEIVAIFAKMNKEGLYFPTNEAEIQYDTENELKTPDS